MKVDQALARGFAAGKSCRVVGTEQEGVVLLFLTVEHRDVPLPEDTLLGILVELEDPVTKQKRRQIFSVGELEAQTLAEFREQMRALAEGY